MLNDIQSKTTDAKLIGDGLRSQRKRLKISAVHAAQAAGVSRVTLHRIENGEASVAFGLYLKDAYALGLELSIKPVNDVKKRLVHGEFPEKLDVSCYPGLLSLAWHLQPGATLSPASALQLYERNWRHLDKASLSQDELSLIKRLACLFGGGTAISLLHGEFRESHGIDFVVSNLPSYRELRQLCTGDRGLFPLFRPGAQIELSFSLHAVNENR